MRQQAFWFRQRPVMPPQRFDLLTVWRLDAPVKDVWDILMAVEDWPLWWRAVSRVELLERGDEHGVGAVHRITWKTALPYTVTIDLRNTRVEPMRVVEGRASGDVDGSGRWTITPEGQGTHVRYDWRVEVTKPWMRLLAPVLRPMFSWNHDQVMAWGYQGIRRRLVELR